MSDYRVETATTGREVYLVTADSPEDAAARWQEGELLVSEVSSIEGVTSVTEEPA